MKIKGAGVLDVRDEERARSVLALDVDGTVYVTTGKGDSKYANSIVALDGTTLKVLRAYSTKSEPFTSTPVVFSEGDRTYVAATTDTSMYVMDAASFAAPVVRTEPQANVQFTGDGVTTWRDEGGTRWLLTAGSGGHFYSQGAINGRAVQFVVDTGATAVSLGQSDAERIGLNYRQHAEETGAKIPVQPILFALPLRA